MGKKVNLRQPSLPTQTASTVLKRMRLGNDPIAFIPFTDEAEEVSLHYCQEVQIRDYIPCNGPGCVNCRIGRKPEARLLLPVFSVFDREVRVLPIPTRRTPEALWPQLEHALDQELRVIVVVSKLGSVQFDVSLKALPPDFPDVSATIRNFCEASEAGRLSLDSVFPSLSDEELLLIPEFSERLKWIGASL